MYKISALYESVKHETRMPQDDEKKTLCNAKYMYISKIQNRQKIIKNPSHKVIKKI